MTARKGPYTRRSPSTATGIAFPTLCRLAGLPEPKVEYLFALPRKWRMDFCWIEQKVGLEVDGGIWMAGGGRHTRGAGWLKDAEKLNTAAMLGYRMLRATPQQMAEGSILPIVAETLRTQ